MNKKIFSHIEKEKDFFNRIFREYIQRSKHDWIWHVSEKIIFVDKYLKGEGWSLLDIGCGAAENIKRNILPKMTKNTQYVGVDISKKLLIQARKNIPQGVFIEIPMSKIKLQKNSFDYICFFGSLHHDEKPERSLSRIVRFLKYGGILFLREPSDSSFKKGEGLSPCEAGIPPHKLRHWLDELNLEIIEWHYLNSELFHFFRRIMNKLKLQNWEKVEFFWVFKTQLELLVEKLKFLPPRWFKGLDMFIVCQKKLQN